MALTTFDVNKHEVLVLHMQPAAISTMGMQGVLLGRLSDDERARYERFRFDEDRHTYLVAHALLRTALAQLAGVSVQALQFTVGEHGRPDPSAPAQAAAFCANLSHTDGLVACAFSRGLPVGVDVEHTARRVEVLSVAERVFSSRELSGLRALHGVDQRDRFFDLWTLKEAYIKAIGKGLAAPLRAITFLADQADPVPVLFGAEAQDDSARWKLRRFAPTAEHRLSVCWAGRDERALRVQAVSAAELLTAVV